MIRSPVVLAVCLSWSTLVLAQTVSLPFGNVLYHHLQEAPAEAYIRALYFEARGLTEEVRQRLTISRAGLALDMSLDELAQQILATLDPSKLYRLDNHRLHFHLARDAYRQHDWQRFEAELALIENTAPILVSPKGKYMRAELARLTGDFGTAEKVIGDISKKNILRYYAGFNLGTTAYAASQPEVARRHLKKLLDQRAMTFEQLMIEERSRMVLANIALNEGRFKRAAKWLSEITATGQYGPAAMATLAHLAMVEQKYAQAADLWLYLVNQSPWHPAVRDVHTSLPFTLEQLRGADNAYGEYAKSARRLGDRREQLVLLLAVLESADPEIYINALLFPEEQAQDPLVELEHQLRHGDWANWLADANAQRLAKTWHRVDAALHQLRKRRGDLDILLQVDAEQMRRIKNARKRLRDDGYDIRLDRVESRLDGLQVKLVELAGSQADINLLMVLATSDEVALLNDLRQMQNQADQLQAGEITRTRIRRMQGVLLYRIYEDLPIRIQKRRAVFKKLVASLDDARARSVRIINAAAVAGSIESVSGRVALLSSRTDRLLAGSERILAATGAAFITQISSGIQSEMDGIEKQLVYVRLAMARVSDAQLLAAEARP